VGIPVYGAVVTSNVIQLERAHSALVANQPALEVEVIPAAKQKTK
jgi:hypothetical protein